LGFGILVLVILLVLVFLFATPFFAVGDQIEVLGSRRTSQEEVASFVREKISGKNIFLLRSAGLAKAIRERFLWAGEVAIHKCPPRGLKIEVLERTPTALVRSGGLLFLVDENGNVFSQVEEGSFDLPVLEISSAEGISLGQIIEDQRVKTHLQLLFLLGQHDLSMKEIEVETDVIRVVGKEGFPILLDPCKDLSTQVSTLDSLLEKYRIEGVKLRKVNFLFDKVVVEY